MKTLSHPPKRCRSAWASRAGLNVPVLAAVALGWIVVSAGGTLHAEDPSSRRGPALPLANLSQRIPWTTSRLAGSPDPAPPFQVERTWPGLKFKDPVDLSGAPGSG